MRAIIDQTSVAMDSLLSFMLKAELWSDKTRLLSWLAYQERRADQPEKDFFHAAITFISRIHLDEPES